MLVAEPMAYDQLGHSFLLKEGPWRVMARALEKGDVGGAFLGWCLTTGQGGSTTR